MSGYDVVLFLHIAAVLAAFFLSGALHVSEYLMRGATTMAEVRRLTRPGRFAVLFGPIVIAIFAFGLALLRQDEGSAWDMGTPFVATGLVVLVVLALDGPLVMGRYAKKLDALVEETPDGPVTDAVRTQIRTPVPWMVGHGNTFAALSVILLMTAKPSWGYCVVVVVVGTAIGASLGNALSRR